MISIKERTQLSIIEVLCLYRNNILKLLEN